MCLVGVYILMFKDLFLEIICNQVFGMKTSVGIQSEAGTNSNV